MCSISLNSIVDQQLNELECSDDKTMMETRLFKFADEANVNTPGALDRPASHMKRMPSFLKDIRKITVGRHRIYYTGHHKHCSYHAVYIKKFKKSGDKDDDNKKFQDKLRRALLCPVGNKITCKNIDT